MPSSRTLLRPAILVLLKEHDDYGYALVERLATAGLNHVDPAALYRTLRALEEEGVVRSRWAGAERGAPRRVYALTDAGERRLRQSLAAVADQRDTLARLVDRGLGRPPHAAVPSQHVACRPCCPPPPVGVRPVRRSRSRSPLPVLVATGTEVTVSSA